MDQLGITDDHERVWNELPPFQRRREFILNALSEGQVRSDDRHALFVGAKVCQEAGGTIIRDLFDAQGGGYFADAGAKGSSRPSSSLCASAILMRQQYGLNRRS